MRGNLSASHAWWLSARGEAGGEAGLWLGEAGLARRSQPGAEKPAWEPVEAEGGIYWWNVDTDETSAVGEPCPAIQPAAQNGQVPQQQGGSPLGQPQQGGGMMSGLGQTMAQGMAFGAGSSVAHSVMGSMFGGGGSSDASPMDNSSSDSYDGGDSYDGDDGGGGDDWA